MELITDTALALLALVSLVAWIGSSVLTAFVAQQKGRSGVGWFLGAFLIFSPLLALIALAALPRRREWD